MISLGRATSGSEFMKDYVKDFVAEEVVKKLFSEDVFKDKSELMQKATMFVYQTYKLNASKQNEIFDAINNIINRGFKGKELLDEIKKQTSIDLTAPADKHQAAKRAVQIMNSEAQ